MNRIIAVFCILGIIIGIVLLASPEKSCARDVNQQEIAVEVTDPNTRVEPKEEPEIDAAEFLLVLAGSAAVGLGICLLLRRDAQRGNL